MSSQQNPADQAVVDRIKTRGLFKRGKDAFKRATTSRSSKEEPRKDVSRLATLLRKTSLSSAPSTPAASAPSTPHKDRGAQYESVKDTFPKAPSKLASQPEDQSTHIESPFATPRSDIPAATPDGSPAPEQALTAPSTPQPRAPCTVSPAAAGMKTHPHPSLSSDAIEEPPSASYASSVDEQIHGEQPHSDSKQMSPIANASTDEDEEYQASHESRPADDDEEIQVTTNHEQGANLATLEDDIPGGGTALPFGEENGPLDGYTTLPDPQEHVNSIQDECDNSDQDECNSSVQQGGKPIRIVFALLLAAAAGAAGIYISSHPAIRPKSRKRSEAEQTVQQQ